jgi:hypothetical protein
MQFRVAFRRYWLSLLWVLLSFGRAVPTAAASPLLPLDWDPCPDPSVTGYLLCYGVASCQYTNQVDVGNVTNALVAGLIPNVTYYFVVIAYDGFGNQSSPSNEIQASTGSLGETPTLSIQLSGPDFAAQSWPWLSFSASSGVIYEIQASVDFTTWIGLWRTNALVSGPIAFADTNAPAYSQRFYRLVPFCPLVPQ